MANDFKQMLSVHKELMNQSMNEIIGELVKRTQEHDMDKLLDSRVSQVYEEHFPKLKQIPFGTEEYLAYEHEFFWDAHMIHAQNRHHYYSEKNNQVKDPNIIDLLEAVVDIYVSNKQYNDNPNINDIIETMNKKGILDYSLEEYIANTLENLEKRECLKTRHS